MTQEELKALKPMTESEQKMAWNTLKVLYIKLDGLLEGLKKDLKSSSPKTS